ncbi:hypothetical protein [Streptomyces virginiae]|uniref:hypothetical protein n=1 Tax=Streptomyces virginiae TaxID=1961 RepID=UPI0036FE7366
MRWHISIYIPTEEQTRNPETDGHHDAERTLAYWSTTGTLGWLRELKEQGKAEEVLASGYPLRHIAHARDVLPLLADETRLGMNGYLHHASIHPGAVAACSEDQLLVIDAMDQS